STVGTQTEVYDYLRLLYARVGTTICRVCGREVHKDSPESAAHEILNTLVEGTRFYVLFPAEAGLRVETNGNGTQPKAKTRKRKIGSDAGALTRQQIVAHVMSLMQRGFTRLYSKGETIELRSPDDYTRSDFADVFVLVDRLAARADVHARLVDSLETCFIEADGVAPLLQTGRHSDGRAFRRAFKCAETCDHRRQRAALGGRARLLRLA